MELGLEDNKALVMASTAESARDFCDGRNTVLRFMHRTDSRNEGGT